MLIEVKRDTFTANSTMGSMFLDGVFHSYTLEPRWDQSKGKPFAIPNGTYAADLEFSEHNGFITPRLQNVPNFTDIEIHPGNTPADTLGCCLIGYTRSTDFVGASRAAFADLLEKLGSQEFSVSYSGEPQIPPQP
jgi:hypothetical protein